MYIDVSEILQTGEGHQADFTIDDETLVFEDIKLTQPVSGKARIIGTEKGVLVTGRFETAVELECSRCLRTFEQPVRFPLQAEFDEAPVDDQFPIDKYGKIDLAQPLWQEIEVHLPISPLCQVDCTGIELKQKKDS